MRTVAKLKNQLNRALRTPYQNLVQTASAYVAIIFSAKTTVDRLDLMIQMLNDHNFGLEEPLANNTPPPYEALDDDVVEAIDQHLKDTVQTLTRELASYELSVEMAAGKLLEYLEGLLDNAQRTVAVARFLREGLLPYVQIPTDLFVEGEVSEAITRITSVGDRERVRRSCIMITQMIGHPKFPHPSLVARSVAKLIAKHRNADEAAILIGHYAGVLVRRGTQSGLHLLEALTGNADEEDEEELDEESLKKISDEDLARHIATCGGPECKYQQEYDRRQREKNRPRA